MKTLKEYLINSINSTLPEGWLYVKGEHPFSSDAICKMYDHDELDDSDLVDDEPKEAVENGMTSTIDNQTVESVVQFAAELEGADLGAILVESFNYYYKYDAFMPEPGFVPLSAEESKAELDREFYEILGPEVGPGACRRESCTRLAIKHSVLCSLHHFENTKGYKYEP